MPQPQHPLATPSTTCRATVSPPRLIQGLPRVQTRITGYWHSTIEGLILKRMRVIPMTERVFVLVLIALTLTQSVCYANSNDQRPFWTEQAAFTFDNELYAIGVATNAESIEAGRQAAFDHGLNEIRNYGQVSNLNNLQVHTQMTFEEPQSDGRVSVWRLLRVSMGELRALKATKTHQALASQQATEVRSTDTPRTAAVNPSLLRSHTTAVITRQPVTTQEVNLPSIPLRYPQVITGWTQDRHGRIGVAWQDRQEWYVPVLKASDLTYHPLLNPR
jgi:hypothetical protein